MSKNTEKDNDPIKGYQGFEGLLSINDAFDEETKTKFKDIKRDFDSFFSKKKNTKQDIADLDEKLAQKSSTLTPEQKQALHSAIVRDYGSRDNFMNVQEEVKFLRKRAARSPLAAANTEAKNNILYQVRSFNVLQAGEIIASNPKLLQAYEDSNIRSKSSIEFTNSQTKQKTSLPADKAHKLQQDNIDLYKQIFEENKENIKTLKPKINKNRNKQTFEIHLPNGENYELTQKIKYKIGLTGVRVYRNVDLPTKLPGRADMFFKLLDKKGKESNLRFSVHYDEQGKLVEMCTPQPIKFSGKGDKSLVMVEVNGKELSLPINRGQFNKMNAEIAQNKGISKEQSAYIAPQKKKTRIEQVAESGKNAIKALKRNMTFKSNQQEKEQRKRQPYVQELKSNLNNPSKTREL